MITITLDGPAGAGKSTIAKLVAKELDILYLDTGAMYRGVAYYLTAMGEDCKNEERIVNLLDSIKLDVKYKDGNQHIYINEEDVSPFIRTNEISMAASTVSKIPKVRIKLVEIQREIAQKMSCVIDGRDIGSYVLPEAKHKFYLTASPEIRAQRRFLEQTDNAKTFDDILEEINIRDKQDCTRDFAPLTVPKGAYIIDSSDLNIQQVKDIILEICK